MIEPGSPDGFRVDADGNVWTSAGDGVHCHAPDGTLLMQIDMPCQRVTKIAFGGPDLRTAYVTTARTGLSEAELARQPLAGGLLAFAAPAPGRPLESLRL